MPNPQKLFESLIDKTDGAELSQMFGKPCAKMNKKAFLCFFQNEVVFKIGKENVEEWILTAKDSKNFDPSGKGRAMKDWLQVPVKNKKHFDTLLELTLAFTFG